VLILDWLFGKLDFAVAQPQAEEAIVIIGIS
jgi:hypothetical protein